jgi:hypothetical protein
MGTSQKLDPRSSSRRPAPYRKSPTSLATSPMPDSTSGMSSLGPRSRPSRRSSCSARSNYARTMAVGCWRRIAQTATSGSPCPLLARDSSRPIPKPMTGFRSARRQANCRSRKGTLCLERVANRTHDVGRPLSSNRSARPVC